MPSTGSQKETKPAPSNPLKEALGKPNHAPLHQLFSADLSQRYEKLIDRDGDEIRINDTEAPDRNEFANYAIYLEACDKWAQEEFAALVDHYNKTGRVTDFGYPGLGKNAPKEAYLRFQYARQIVKCMHQLERMALYRELIETIDDEWAQIN